MKRDQNNEKKNGRVNQLKRNMNDLNKDETFFPSVQYVLADIPSDLAYAVGRIDGQQTLQ